MLDDASLFAHITDTAIRARLVELRERVTPILANNLLPHFTDHSVEHSDSLVHIVDQFVRPLQESRDRLSQDELQILYSACYLHDIGMQYENADQTQVISNLQLRQSWSDLSEDTRRSLLREHHGAISAEMVIMSVRAEHPPIGIQLKEDHYAKYVAPICEGHTLDTVSDRYVEIIREGPNIRTLLLSALLRVADILDLSQRRANADKARTLRLNVESKTHWWRHYYTENVRIDPTEKSVTIWFDFPEDRFDEYRSIIPALQMPWIREEFNRHAAIFNRYGLGWTVQEHVERNVFSTAEVMPDDVEAEMLRQYRRNQVREEERQRRALEELFSQAKPHIERRLAMLEAGRTTLPPHEFLREIANIANDLWNVGGRRSAWSLLSQHYHAQASSLQPNERLEMGITLATMMFEDSDFEGTERVLRVLLPLAAHLPNGDLTKTRLTLLWSKTLVSVGNYAVGGPFVAQAIDSVLEIEDKETLRAELAELQFLYGDVENALNTSEEAP